MGILLGLLAALCWGSADFLVRYSTHLIGTYRTLFFMQFISFLFSGTRKRDEKNMPNG